MKQNDSTDLRENLASHALILDTSFAMQPGFAQFLVNYASSLQSNNMLVPRLVVDELKKLTTDLDERKRESATRALRLLKELVAQSMAQVRHEESDTYVDQVIQRVVEQHMLRRDILVLTNDAPLMRDIRAKLRKESVRTRHSIRVVKLHARTNEPVEFYPHKDSRETSDRPQRPRIRVFDIATEVVRDDSFIPTTRLIDVGSELTVRSGFRISLGKKIAEGGEGEIYEVPGRDEVCKIYRSDKLVRSKEGKINLMLSRRLEVPGICWPMDLVCDLDGNFRGYLMPRAQGRPLGHTLFLPKQFLAANPSWTRRDSVQLALSILEHIRVLHDLNILIGDINPQNILFTDATHVWIVDCDSFQVEGYPCPVGTVNFSAPEIQGQDFRTFLRNLDHELFAVATLLFMIMFPGKSPYSHSGGSDGASNIRKMEFPYTRDRSNSARRAPSGVWTCCWSHLTMHLKDAFSRSFSREAVAEPRVTIAEWAHLFRGYARTLSNDERVFMGPTPKVGYDLSIMPHSHRYTEDKRDSLPHDGKSDYERLLFAMVKAAQQKPGTTQIPVPPRTAPPSPALGAYMPKAATVQPRAAAAPSLSSKRPVSPTPRVVGGSRGGSAQKQQPNSDTGCLALMLLLGSGVLGLALLMIGAG